MEFKVNIIANIDEYKNLAKDPVKNRDTLDSFTFIYCDGTTVNARDIDEQYSRNLSSIQQRSRTGCHTP